MEKINYVKKRVVLGFVQVYEGKTPKIFCFDFHKKEDFPNFDCLKSLKENYKLCGGGKIFRSFRKIVHLWNFPEENFYGFLKINKTHLKEYFHKKEILEYEVIKEKENKK